MSKSVFPNPETVSALLILSTIFHALALILTSFRLWFRYHIRRLWWDDFWAALALGCDAVCMVAAWTLTAPIAGSHVNPEALPTSAQSRNVHILSYWLSIIFYTCSIWFARLSIVFSVVRIVPPARNVSMSIFCAGVVFACMWVYVLASKTVVCAMDKSWYHAVAPGCTMPNWVALSEVCTDTLSDIILVILPVRLLWRVKLPSNERIMLLSVFSTSILVSVVSAVHTSYIIPIATFNGGATAEIESAVSLIVCNLLVIVTFIYRVTRNGRDLTEGIPDNSNRLTTIDLDISGGSLFSSMTHAATGTGTGTGMIGTGSTGTQITATETDLSSLKCAGWSDRDTPFGSIIVTGGTVLPAPDVSRDMHPPPTTTTQY